MGNKIFLVEDEIELIEIYRTVLEREGLKLEAVRFGFEAEREIKKWLEGKKEKPDLILLDLVLPDTNGILLLEQIKKEEKLKDIPVYILTNYTSKEMELMGLERQAEKYIVKTDITPLKLVEIIKEALEE